MIFRCDAAGDTTVRIPCCVPFCRRSRRRQEDDHARSEWMCGPHWRLVSPAARGRRNEAARLWRSAKRREILHGGDPKVTDRLCARFDARWGDCKREAIEVAAGITGTR